MNNRYAEIKERAKRLSDAIGSVQHSPSYARVVGVLSGLGFLIAPHVRKLPSSKVDFDEALKIGVSVEPRVLEVLPAAVLSCPRSFLGLEKAPQEFMGIVRALKSGKSGPNFHGIEFRKFLEAANRPVKNRRRKALGERKIPKTFRFSPVTVKTIQQRALEMGIDQTRYVEELIARENS